MHVDIEGAARIARIAADFEWTWTLADLPPFCVKTGWKIIESREHGVGLATDLSVNQQHAPVYLVGGLERWRRDRSVIRELSIFVADVSTEPDVTAQINTAVTALVERLAAVLGSPGPSEANSMPAARWDLPNVVIRLSGSLPDLTGNQAGSIFMHLVNPASQALSDSADELLEQQLREEGRWVDDIDPPADWPELADRLASVMAELPMDSVVHLGTTGNRYVQLGRSSKVGQSSVELWCEVVCNAFLEEGHRMTAADEAAMNSRGWAAPSIDTSANWYREIPSPASDLEYALLAEQITNALSTVLRVDTPNQLEATAWADAPTNPIDVSALGLRSHPEM